MKPYTPKRQEQNREADKVRDELKRRIGRCEICLKPRSPDYLCGHEISRGSGLRLRALDKPFAILIVCRDPNFLEQSDCHRAVQAESEARQLARLYLCDQSRFDLAGYLRLTRPQAPLRITQDEVDLEIEALLN